MRRRTDSVRVLDPAFWNETQPVLMGGDVGLEKWLENRKEFQGHVIFKTSGSSGLEKWVSLSREALEWSARSVIRHLQITERDVLGLALPVHHVGGFGLMARGYFSGARVVELGEAWIPERFARWCEEAKVTVSSLVPTQVHDLVRAGLRGAKSLRVIVVGGGRLDQEVIEKARALGWPVEPSYGMTETGSQIATGDGLPLIEGWEVRIENDCLVVKGKGLCSWIIYRRGNEFESIDPKRDGWFFSKDLAEINDRGLKILGRADRRVKILGELVNLEKVEDDWGSLLGCPVAVMTQPDPRRGVSLWLIVEGESRQLGSLNNERPGLERLAGWGFLDQLPRSSLGKIDRSSLQNIHVEYDCAKGESRFT